MSLCLYILEGTVEDAFPLESPLTIYHSRRMKGGSKLVVEVVMGERPSGVGRGLGLLTGVALSRKKPAGVGRKAQGSAGAAPEKAVGSQPQRRAASRSEPRGGGGGTEGRLRWWPGGLVGGDDPLPILHRKIKAAREILPSRPQSCSVQG